ncbi:MAP kinase kinase (MEK) [Entophlyctis luteolus]|nr:MAP kinase kinase (MEK) [Entophlyctis luteolus]KAJ3345525.1 MAP kinase kinase (MEK) [Entophlyctis luteolus]KAJ3383665.1 MAP kinase kinase (MEK) [Entophlyctis sp. JEL0112]
MPPPKLKLNLQIPPGSSSAGASVIAVADQIDAEKLLPSAIRNGVAAFAPVAAETSSSAATAGTAAKPVKLQDADLEFVCELGAGNGGTVSKVRHTPTGTLMARKNIYINVDDEGNRKKAERQLKAELRILSICQSEFIVGCYGAFIHDGGVSVCLEYMDLGSLDGIYRKLGPIDEATVVKIAVHVLKGLLYLADNKILHRDIKPSNILLNSKGQIKITDFGVSKQVHNTVARTFTGTQGYLAPERITSDQVYTVKSDIWALGLTLIELATAKHVYQNMTLFEMMTHVTESPPPSLPPGKFTPLFDDLISHCVAKDEEVRSGPEELLRHPYCMDVMEGGINLLEWANTIPRET